MLESALLPASHGLIGGRWSSGTTTGTFAVRNPATGETLAELPRMGKAEAEEAVSAAAAQCRQPPDLAERRRFLARIAELIIAHQDEIGRIITLEQGKPLAEGSAEARYAAGFFGYCAGHLHELHPKRVSDDIKDCAWTVHYRPAGVAAAITPWNFPIAMLAKKMAAALGAGCAMVCKPAGQTPLAALALGHLTLEAGTPAGMVNIVFGDTAAIGEVLCTHPAIRVLSFTGSTSVGRKLAAAAGPHLKRVALELGGNAPFLVFPDADLPAMADALIANKFRAGGQTCVCTNRVLVHRDVHDRFASEVAARVAKLKVGNGMETGVDVGPLINRDGWDKVARHVNDALERGATRLVGEDPARPPEDWGCYYPPTVLTGVKAEMLVCREETFGPVVAIGSFTDEDEAIAMANSGSAGLAAYVCTADPERQARLAAALHYGHVGVNTGTGPTPEAPFGGMRDSGYGREGGVEGLLEYCEPQTVATAKT